jgi:heptosyltransferase II
MLPKIHICLIRYSSMGDVILQTSLVAALKESYGDKLKITFITSKEFKTLLDDHPLIDEVIAFDRSKEVYRLFLKRIKSKSSFDFIFDLHATLRSKLFRMKFCCVPSLSVDKRTIEREIFCKTKIKLFNVSNDAQVRRLISDFKQILGLANFDEISSFVSTIIKTPKSSDQLTTSKYSFYKIQSITPIISIIPTASFFYKRWPIESFVSLTKQILECEKLNKYEIKILAGPDDNFCKVFDEIALSSNGRVENLQGKTSLDQSCEIVAKSSLVVGNDTGLIHVAESLGINVIDIFGPTHEFFGFGPYLKDSHFLSANESCSPCSSKGNKKCHRDQHYCMLNIEAQTILSKMKESIDAATYL